MEMLHISRTQQIQHDKLLEMVRHEHILQGESQVNADDLASTLIYHPMELVHLPSSLKERLLGNAEIMGYLFIEGWAPTAIHRLALNEREVEVNLSGSEVDDHFLKSWAKVPAPAVTSLILSDCSNITDKGLQALVENAPNLTHIDLRDCENITTKGVNALRNLGLTVDW